MNFSDALVLYLSKWQKLNPFEERLLIDKFGLDREQNVRLIQQSPDNLNTLRKIRGTVKIAKVCAHEGSLGLYNFPWKP